LYPKSILNRYAKIPLQQYFPKVFGMNLDFGTSIRILNLTVLFYAQPWRFNSPHFAALS
jgi:hypothetical protein